MTALQDHEGVEHLLAEHGAATPVVGQGGQRIHHRIAADIAAVVTLKPPKRHKDAAGHAILPLKFGQERGVFCHHGAAIGDAPGGDRAVDVTREGIAEFGLTAIESDDGGQRLDAGQSLRNDSRTNAALRRIGACRLQPSCEACIRGRRYAGGSGRGGFRRRWGHSRCDWRRRRRECLLAGRQKQQRSCRSKSRLSDTDPQRCRHTHVYSLKAGIL